MRGACSGLMGPYSPHKSVLTFFISSHTSRLRSGLRRRNAGWNVGTTFAPRYSYTRPRIREIGSSVLKSVRAANVPSATITFGLIASTWANTNGSQVRTSSGAGLRFSGGRTLDDVGDIHLIPREANRFDDLRQQLTGASHKWDPLRVFIATRGLADEHELGFRVTDPEDDLRAVRVERAAGAVAELLPGSAPVPARQRGPVAQERDRTSTARWGWLPRLRTARQLQTRLATLPCWSLPVPPQRRRAKRVDHPAERARWDLDSPRLRQARRRTLDVRQAQTENPYVTSRV